MKNNRIISRNNEIKILDRVCERNDASLVAVYGRRRVGKTFLIHEYFDNEFTFNITGTYKKGLEFQLSAFLLEYIARTGKQIDGIRNWGEAFMLLTDYLLSLPEDEKKVVLFDEMPWLDTPKSDFVSHFENFWNKTACGIHNLIFIACGSSAMWMDKNIISNKGGLFYRSSAVIYLEPFNLLETEQYLKSIGINYSRFDIANAYLIFGGIPYYFNFLDRRMTLMENVDRLLFQSNDLKKEFSVLFDTLFSSSEQYLKIIKALSSTWSGLTRDEISETTGIIKNGDLTKKLDNLIKTGFIRTNEVHNGKKSTKYMMKDFFTIFYFHCIYGKKNLPSNYFSLIYNTPSYYAYRGHAFEVLCLEHLPQIKKSLGISGIYSSAFSWMHKADENIEGAQIDLFIKRNDRVGMVVEIKFTNEPYIITKKDSQDLARKISVYRAVSNSKNTILPVLISASGVGNSEYLSTYTYIMELDDLFN